MRLLRGMVVGALLAAGCGTGSRAYRGTPGQPVQAVFDSLVSLVPVSIDGAAARPFLVDTGARATVLDAPQFSTVPAWSVVDVQAFGLDFPAVDVQRFHLFRLHPSVDRRLGGVIGGDLLEDFAVRLDYEGGRVSLFDPSAAPTPTVPAAAGAPILVPFDLEGGGTLVEPTPLVLDASSPPVAQPPPVAPATRVVVDVSVEGGPPVAMMVDTGASFVILDDDLAAQLGTPHGPRPTLDGLTVDLVFRPVPARLIRIAHLRLGPAGGPHAGADDVIAMVLPGSRLFEILSSEAGERIHGVIGGSFLCRYLTTVDYPRRRLELAPYRDGGPPLGHLVGFGLDLGETTAGAARVQDVLRPSAAADAGVQVGEELVALDGDPVAGIPFAAVLAVVRDHGAGDRVDFTLRRPDGTRHEVALVAGPLLDDYPHRPGAFQPGERVTPLLGYRPVAAPVPVQ